MGGSEPDQALDVLHEDGVDSADLLVITERLSFDLERNLLICGSAFEIRSASVRVDFPLDFGRC